MTLFQTTRRIEFCDTDMAGIVHFANFFRFMESAEVAFLRSLGLNVSLEWEGLAIGFPRVSASCDYIRPAKFEDVLDIAVSLVTIGQKSVTYGFDFTRDNELIARGKVTSVCCRVTDAGMESMEIPERYRQMLTSASGDAGDRPTL